MSIKYLNHINLQGNRIEGAAIEPLGSAPSNNLQIGRVYYDTSDNTNKTLKIYDGSNFVSITGDVTGVANTTTGQLTITNPNGPVPSFAIVTGAVSNNGAGLATQAQIKSYVDSKVTAEDLDFQGDSGTGSVDLDSQTFAITGDTGITTTASNQGLSIDLDNTAVTPGSYGSSTAIPTFTVDQQGRLTAAGTASITTTLDIAADSGTDDGVRLGTDTLTISGTANEIETSVSGDTITVGLPNDVSINSQLTVGTASGTDAPVIKSISNSTAENILLEGRETSASSAPDLVLYRNAGTPADSDTLGVLEFRGRNAMGTPNTADISYAGFYSRIYDASNQDSVMSLSLNKGNGSGAYKSAAIFKLLGSNNSGTGALLINPANDLSVPTHNLDVNGTAHFSGPVTFAGNVTISGNQITKNSETVLIEDNIITLNSNETGTPSEDGGIEVERGTADNVKLYWDESTDRWSQRTGTGTEYKLHTEEHDVALGTHTSGNYVASISAGTNISLTNAGAGEGKTHQISVTGLDNYDYWNLKVNGSSVDNISSQESLDFVNGNAITVSFANGEDIRIDHNDTSSQASVNNSGNTVIQDVTLDTYGHVTGLTSKTIESPTDRMYADTIGDGSTLIYNLDNNGASSPHKNHGLGTDSSQFMVQLVEVSSGETVHADVIRGSSGRVTVTFATGNAPSSNGIRVLINKIG